MPIGSAEIAAMNGAWQQQAMQRTQYGSMIGQPGDVYGGGYQSGAMGDRMMGGAMSRASAIGGPVMGMAGGIMAPGMMASGAWAGGGALLHGAGLGGAAAAGGMAALGAIPAMAAFGAASYAGGQMMQGASQQMDLNQTLRGSYNFRNQQGGQGFNRGDMTSIGSMVRDMSGQFGPGGEVTGFRELTQLAGKMNTMGLAQGVKDVKDFAEKFKTMVTSLKSMATDLGTTLEGAMEFAAAAKQSGVFGMKNAAAFTHAARSTAVAGGLAVSEVTAAASTGSQISRAMGGLGSQGAGAGMRTIGQIGSAVQMGVLSEKDIYNVTGLTGAEGRQAYATSSMEKTAGFLQSGRGRRMLASIAGKDGTLDESSVQEFLSGGMTIQETMRLDNKMKSTVGRANFIRNEGRLRGAAMEKLGAFIPAMQMAQWAASKGIDINEMDDRSMLFAQRQLGMGRDEVDQAVKMAKAMPQIMRQQRQVAEDDEFHQGVGLQRKQMGLEGIKTRFDQAKEVVNSKLQKVGQDVLNAGSEAVDSFFAKLSGQYTQTVSEKADAAYRAAMFGGAAGKSSYQTYFGGKPAGLAGRGSDMLNSGIANRTLDERMNQGSQGGFEASLKKMFTSSWKGGDSGGELFKFLTQGQSGAGKDKEDGYDLGGLSGSALADKMTKINDMVNAASNEAPSADYIAIGKQNSKWMNSFYASSLGGLKGEERMNEWEKGLVAQSPAMAEKLKGMSSAEKVRLMSGMEVGADIAIEARAASTIKAPGMGAFSVGFKGTEADRQAAYAAAFGTQRGGKGEATVDQFGRPTLLGATVDTGTDAMRKGLGRELASDTYREYVHGVFGSNSKVSDQMQTSVQREIQSLAQDTSEEATGKRAALEGLLASKAYQDLGPNVTDEQANKIMEKYGGLKALGLSEGGKAGLEKMLNANAGIHSLQGQEMVMGQAMRRQKAGAADVRGMARMGVATFEGGGVKLSGATLESIKGIKGGEAVLQAAIGASAAEANINLTDAATAASGLDKSEKGWQSFQDQLAGLSVADKRKMAAATAGTTIGAMIGESAAAQAGLDKGLKKRGGSILGAAAGGLGITLTADEKKQFGLSRSERSEEGTSAAAELLASKLGIHGGSDALQTDLKQYLNDLRTGNTGQAAKGLQGIMSNEDVVKARKEQNEKQQEEKDPLSAAIKKNGEEANKLLTALLKSTDGGRAALNELNAKTKASDPERQSGANAPGTGTGERH